MSDIEVNLSQLGILGGVLAGVMTAYVKLYKRKPESAEIQVNMALKLTESQMSLITDRDSRLQACEQKLGVLNDTVDEMREAIEKVEQERDNALERARKAEAKADQLQTRVTSLEEEVARLKA